jgi:hypothetical protein
MKKSLVAVAFLAATASMIFGAPQSTTPAAGSNAPKAAAQTTNKHVKKSHKAKKQAAATNATAPKPATK